MWHTTLASTYIHLYMYTACANVLCYLYMYDTLHVHVRLSQNLMCSRVFWHNYRTYSLSRCPYTIPSWVQLQASFCQTLYSTFPELILLSKGTYSHVYTVHVHGYVQCICLLHPNCYILNFCYFSLLGGMLCSSGGTSTESLWLGHSISTHI